MNPVNPAGPALKLLLATLQEQAIPYYLNTPITPYVTMGIGGVVPVLVVVSREDQLERILHLLYSHQHPYLLLGGGSNVVFPDAFSHPEMVVLINRTADIQKTGNHLVQVSSGLLNSRLMAWNIENGIGGMDFLAGIPGTVGGAAAVNGGAFGQSISSLLSHARIFDRNGQVQTVSADYFQFQYRHSIFKCGSETIIHLFLKYQDEESQSVREKVTARIQYRLDNHPAWNLRSAGCFFKNPLINGQKTSAGKLIQEAGFKGKTFKTLGVAESHCNFIINNGSASFADIVEVEQTIRQGVAMSRGVDLEREVIYISPTGEKY